MYLNVNKLESSIHTYSMNIASVVLTTATHTHTRGTDTRTRSAIFLRNKVLPMRQCMLHIHSIIVIIVDGFDCSIDIFRNNDSSVPYVLLIINQVLPSVKFPNVFSNQS